MKRLCLCFLFLYLSAWAAPAAGPGAIAEGKALLTGRISDAAGRPVEGAMVFVYNSPSVRRSADFMSAPSAEDGAYRVFLPPGRYWAVARLKKSAGVGALMPGDKHSGDPVEVDLDSEDRAVVDFTVADLREAMVMREKSRESALRVSGRIVDEKGSPVAGVYAVAGSAGKVAGIPDYLSAWTDEDGRYTLYVPKGRYYLGSAAVFPPGKSYVGGGEIAVGGDRDGADIVRKSRQEE